MNYRILLTGGAGYLGSALVPLLLSRGNRVAVLDNFMFSQNSLADVCSHDDFSMVRGDARDEETVRALVQQADIVIPLAGIVGAPACDLDRTAAETTNLEAVKTIVRHISPDQMILIPTTNSGYGIGGKEKYCTEESPLNPISLYGRTKVEAEKVVLDRGNSVSLRLATVFGMAPRMRTDLLVNDFVYRAVNDRFVVIFEGHFKRNYIHVRDVARAFMHAIENFDEMKDDKFNVGLSDANLSKIELCEEIKKQLESFVYLEAPVGEDTDKRDYIVSNEKIEKTGFLPSFTLAMGIRELIKGYVMLRDSRYRNV